MEIKGVIVDDTYAEAFPMKATRLIITAVDLRWAYHAAVAATGFATSVIGCGCEAGIERELKPSRTPDGRPGLSVLLFAMSAGALVKQLQNRVGQCVLTSPTSACFSGMAEGEEVPLGKSLRFFGDGHQISKKLGDTRYWRIPVMEGEFLCEDSARITKAFGGGNFLVIAETQRQGLAACEQAIRAMRRVRDVILPFPGGIVRAGSKVGSKYPQLRASTHDAFCPTLRGQVATQLEPQAGAVLEIVIDGLHEQAIRRAIRAGVVAACSPGRKDGVLRISAGNYGGKLGPYHFHLREILG
jgi:formylmethanofuran--tetrahydromethanopterin N-formyltransferase